jgi:chromosome segregation ATPase
MSAEVKVGVALLALGGIMYGGMGSQAAHSQGLERQSTSVTMGGAGEDSAVAAEAPMIKAPEKRRGKKRSVQDLQEQLIVMEDMCLDLEQEKARVVAAMETQLGVEAEKAAALTNEVRKLRQQLWEATQQSKKRSTAQPTTSASAAETEAGKEASELQKQLDELRMRESGREELLKETTDALYEWKDAYEALEGSVGEYESEINALTAELELVHASK